MWNPHLPSDLQIQPASVSVDLNPVLQNVTSGDRVSSDSSCGDGTDAPHSDGASAPSEVDVDATHGEASHSRIVDDGPPDTSDVGTPFDVETDSPCAVDVSNQVQKRICDESNTLVGNIGKNVDSHVQDPAISSVLINHNSFLDREGNLNPNSIELPKSISLQLIKSAQESDPLCRKVRLELQNCESYKLSANVELILRNDLIHKVNHSHSNAYSLFIPNQLVPLFLKIFHDQMGHLSYNYVAEKISKSFYFENLYCVVQDYIRKCVICQKDTTNRHHKNVPSDPIELTDMPFSHIALDYVTHFDTSHSGNTYLLTVIDVATRYGNAIPVKTLTAEESIEKLKSLHILKFGFPKKITTDNGRQFTSVLFSNFCKDNNIKHVRTSPMHPQSNGISESFNGTLSDMIKHSCLDDPRSWDDHVDQLLFSYNSTKRSGTKFTPHELVFTYTPHDNISIESTLPEAVPLGEFVIIKHLDAIDDRRMAKDNLCSSQNVNKALTDISAIPRTLSIGDQVLMKTQSRSRGKMKLRWNGPYPVTNCLSEKNFEILVNGQKRSYHIDLLKLFNANDDLTIPDDSDTSTNDDDDAMINNVGFLPVYDVEKDITVSKICSDVSVGAKVQSLLDDFPNLYSDKSSVTNVLTCEISLSDNTPVKKLPYPVPLSYRTKFKETLDQMLEDDVIEPSSSDYSSPCIIVPKKDSDELRIVVDYKSLNSKVVKDREPISNTQAIFSSLSSCKYFSTIDLRHGFWQIPLTEQSRKYTAFITEFCLFQFKVLPFGITTGPAVFSRLMRKVFVNTPNVYTFLDDVFIATPTLEEHFETLNNVFTLLSNANLKINLKKSHFCAESINLLGQTLNSEFVHPQLKKIDAINNFVLPRT